LVVKLEPSAASLLKPSQELQGVHAEEAQPHDAQANEEQRQQQAQQQLLLMQYQHLAGLQQQEAMRLQYEALVRAQQNQALHQQLAQHLMQLPLGEALSGQELPQQQQQLPAAPTAMQDYAWPPGPQPEKEEQLTKVEVKMELAAHSEATVSWGEVPEPAEERAHGKEEEADEGQAEDDAAERAAELQEVARMRAEVSDLKARIAAVTGRGSGGFGGGGALSAEAEAMRVELEAQVAMLESHIPAFEGSRSGSQAGLADFEAEESQADGGVIADSDTEGSSEEAGGGAGGAREGRGGSPSSPTRKRRRPAQMVASPHTAALERTLDDLVALTNLAESDWASVFAEGIELVEDPSLEGAWDPTPPPPFRSRASASEGVPSPVSPADHSDSA